MLAQTLARALLLSQCIACAFVADAATVGQGGQVQIRQGPLSAALRQVARQTGAEILYDPQIVRGRTSGSVRGRMSADAALARVLAGTGIGYRRAAGGAFVLFVLPREAPPARVAAPAPEPPIPEILVVGRRSQNADIRRTRNDIQPYYVSTRSDVENAHSDNITQFMRSRISSDAEFVTPAQDVTARPGVVRSEIDLRGLGPLRTLVLVDGRRMPGVPTPQVDFDQPDVNAIPSSLIERIETLTGTAGGIYGPGAIGGVVNIVLRRDYRGADIHLVTGVTDRGDSERLGIEARFGFTPDDGRTDVMIAGSHVEMSPLLAGQRDFAVRSRRRQFANDPARYLALGETTDAVTVSSLEGNLTLDPEFGGGDLGSIYTYLPIGFSGTDAERNALLTANAGSQVLRLAEDVTGTRRYIVSNPTVTSGLVNVRHRFGDRLEAFAELLYLRNVGESRGQSGRTSFDVVPNAPNNPFQQFILVQFPRPGLIAEVRDVFESARFTTGIIAELGSGWSLTADLSLGRFRTSSLSTGASTGFDYFLALRQGTSGPDGRPLVDPLRDWPRFLAATAANLSDNSVEFRQVNHFSVAAVRLAGPVVELPGGPLSATLLADRRREFVPTSQAKARFGDLTIEFPLPTRRQTITSGYAELRAPITPAEAGPFLLRGLELQLAARYDGIVTEVPENAAPAQPSNDRLTDIENGDVTFTFGGRILPSRALMLRASVATGDLPPTIEQLSSDIITFTGDDFGPPDPLRGNRFIGTEGNVVLLRRGSNEIEAERATTFSAGIVLNPEGGRWPRLSIDYSRIDKRGEVTFFDENTASLVTNSADFPDRVERAPLTDADRALGFTAGRIVRIDARARNEGRTILEVLDAQLEWILPIDWRGEFRAYGNAAWYLSFRKRTAPGAPWVQHVGYTDGPLAWRGNLGLEWSDGPLLIGVNLQYFDSYRSTYTIDGIASLNPLILAFQGPRVPPQAYLDLFVRRSFDLHGSGPLRRIEANFGIQNLLDQRPPTVADPTLPGYSFHGDARRRRFALVLSGEF